MTVSFSNTGHDDEFLSALRESVAAVEGHKIQEVSSHVIVSVVRAMSRLLPVKWFRQLTSRFTGSMDTTDKGTSATWAAAYGMMVAKITAKMWMILCLTFLTSSIPFSYALLPGTRSAF